MVVGERQILPMVPLITAVVVVGRTWWIVVMVREMMICILLILLLPGLLSKAMSNRTQNLHLFGVLLPY